MFVLSDSNANRAYGTSRDFQLRAFSAASSADACSSVSLQVWMVGGFTAENLTTKTPRHKGFARGGPSRAATLLDCAAGTFEARQVFDGRKDRRLTLRSATALVATRPMPPFLTLFTFFAPPRFARESFSVH